MGAEPHQLVVVEPLAAKPQHKMIAPGLFDRVHHFGRKLGREVDALDIGAERRPGRSHRYRLPIHNRCHSPLLQFELSFCPSPSR
jgi:hypothetical protein